MKISYDAIEQYRLTIDAIITNMKDLVDDMKLKGQSLENSEYWVSDASDHYVKKLDSLLSNFDEVYEKLKLSNVFLEQSSNNYKDIDSMIMSSLRL